MKARGTSKKVVYLSWGQKAHTKIKPTKFYKGKICRHLQHPEMLPGSDEAVNISHSVTNRMWNSETGGRHTNPQNQYINQSPCISCRWVWCSATHRWGRHKSFQRSFEVGCVALSASISWCYLLVLTNGGLWYTPSSQYRQLEGRKCHGNGTSEVGSHIR